MDKTLAMKLLEGKGVPYQAFKYPDTERDAMVVAQHIGAPAGQVFKTLVAKRTIGKPMLVLVPADRELDLKKLAKAVGEKKVKMASHQEAEEMTGLEVGGISPLALINQGFDVIIDHAARDWEQIFVSAGQKGINLKVPVDDLVTLTRAKVKGVSAQ